MSNMGTVQIVVLVFSLIAVAPFCLRFISAILHALVCKAFPVQKITIQHKHDGQIVNSITVDLKSSIPLVTQIALASNKENKANE